MKKKGSEFLLLAIALAIALAIMVTIGQSNDDVPQDLIDKYGSLSIDIQRERAELKSATKEVDNETFKDMLADKSLREILTKAVNLSDDALKVDYPDPIADGRRNVENQIEDMDRYLDRLIETKGLIKAVQSAVRDAAVENLIDTVNDRVMSP
ncbi:MAG: hypothetical protein LBL08_02190 [Candidatus Nomurabacteria bacterium]|jgi:hypothetical protein|nr:hypothetical protein [Candidatus Nomurabacteria bacterium]